MKHDSFTMALLYDYYGDLLTEKQRTCFELYYNQDLSLSEIAEETGVTRQGVHDALSRGRLQLISFEQTLGCIARDAQLRTAAEEIAACARRLREIPAAQEEAEKILQAVSTLKE